MTVATEGGERLGAMETASRKRQTLPLSVVREGGLLASTAGDTDQFMGGEPNKGPEVRNRVWEGD